MSQQRHAGHAGSSRTATTSARVDQQAALAIEMIKSLRVAELQMFLSEVGQSKAGRKADLQARAVAAVSTMTPANMQRLQQLHASRQGVAPVPSLAPLASKPVDEADRSGSGSCSADPLATYQSMPPLSQFFSTPSSMLSKAGLRTHVPEPQQQQVMPQLEEMSSVRFSALPFCEEMHCLIPATHLNPNTARMAMQHQEKTQTFTLTAEQANALSMNRKIVPNASPAFDGYNTKVEFRNQLLLRFALSSAALVEDCFPPALCVRVNGKLCSLPPALLIKNNAKDRMTSQDAIRMGLSRSADATLNQPIDVTSLTKFSPVVANQISITWNQPVVPAVPYNASMLDFSKRFVFTLVMVAKLSAEDLVSKIKAKGMKSAEYTKSIIKDKLRDEDAEIATTSLRASLLCPLAKMRIRNPGRSLSCSHIQCFDIQFFLQMNEKKPTWLCPVCDRRINFPDLVIDGMFSEILASDKSLQKTEVQFDEVNGSIEWSPIVKEEKKVASVVADHSATPSVGKRKSDDDTLPKKKICIPEIITLDDSEDNSSSSSSSSSSSAPLLFSGNAQSALWTSGQIESQQLIELNDDDESSVVMDFTMPSSSSPRSLFSASGQQQSSSSCDRALSEAAAVVVNQQDSLCWSSMREPHHFANSNRAPHIPYSTAAYSTRTSSTRTRQYDEEGDDDDDDISIIE